MRFTPVKTLAALAALRVQRCGGQPTSPSAKSRGPSISAA